MQFVLKVVGVAAQTNLYKNHHYKQGIAASKNHKYTVLYDIGVANWAITDLKKKLVIDRVLQPILDIDHAQLKYTKVHRCYVHDAIRNNHDAKLE